MLMIKYDGKVRGEIYSEILPFLEEFEKENELSSNVIIENREEESSAMHPSDRAKSFLERIGRT